MRRKGETGKKKKEARQTGRRKRRGKEEVYNKEKSNRKR